MALPLNEILREARSIPCFNGTDDYCVSSFTRDVESVITLTNPEDRVVVQRILSNKLRGKALSCIESLFCPTFEQILFKLTEEFGIKESFVSLRNEAMSIRPRSIKDLHEQLNKILSKMNKKFMLEGNVNELYKPENNEKLIFDVYVSYLPCHVKTLLIQSKITNLNKAYMYYVENQILDEIEIVGVSNNFQMTLNNNLLRNRSNFSNSFKSNGYNDVANYAQNFAVHNRNTYNKNLPNGQSHFKNSNNGRTYNRNFNNQHAYSRDSNRRQAFYGNDQERQNYTRSDNYQNGQQHDKVRQNHTQFNNFRNSQQQSNNRQNGQFANMNNIEEFENFHLLQSSATYP